jgi:hypothetical protein
MRPIHRLGAIAAAATLAAITAITSVSADEAVKTTPSPAAASAALDIARLTTDGKLQKPADLESWIFLGTSLGMGYNPGSFNAARPGQFQVVLMEPNAYRHFVKHKSFAQGSMFLLSFYDTDSHKRSINQNGFTQADLTNYEIHVLDPKAEKGHAFYMFGAQSASGNAVPPGNACVRCHVDHGAFQGTFAQFYPTLRPHIPKEALEKAARNHDIR